MGIQSDVVLLLPCCRSSASSFVKTVRAQKRAAKKAAKKLKATQQKRSHFLKLGLKFKRLQNHEKTEQGIRAPEHLHSLRADHP